MALKPTIKDTWEKKGNVKISLVLHDTKDLVLIIFRTVVMFCFLKPLSVWDVHWIIYT